MWFLVIGLILGILKYLEISPGAGLSWLQVAIPFGLAVVWWTWADWSGYTKKKVMQRENERRQERIDRQRNVLGMGPGRKTKK